MLLYYITDRLQLLARVSDSRTALLEKIGEAAEAGVDYIQLREKDLPPRELEALARAAVQAIRTASGKSNGTKLLINSRTDIALAVGAVAVIAKQLDDPFRRRQELLNDPDIKNYPNIFHLLNYPFKNPWFFDMVMNPLDGPFWKDRSVYPFYDKIKVPTFVVGKVAHESGAYWDVYANINTTKKLLVKPNGPEERPWREDHELILRWHDHWLKGNDTGVLDEPNIREVIAFPKNQAGRDVMADAPSFPDDRQLKELHIKITE